MKISELIVKLEEIKNREGDIAVSVHADPETNNGSPRDFKISFVTWDPAPKSLMICDSFTWGELNS